MRELGRTYSSCALSSVAQLVGRLPTKAKVAGLIPGQGTCLVCGFSPQLWNARSNESRFLKSMFLSLFLPSPLSKNKLNLLKKNIYQPSPLYLAPPSKWLDSVAWLNQHSPQKSRVHSVAK